MKSRRAVVLLSGGLDSATALYKARKDGYRCFCLIFDYGQRHRKELRAARRVAESAGAAYEVVKIGFPQRGSSLLDKRLKLVSNVGKGIKIPPTYVPGRNIVFLSYALSFAEIHKAQAIFIGAHALDYSGYPDCRPEFFRAFRNMARLGTKAGIENKSIRILAPLLHKNKAQIIRLGKKLGVPFELTWSCYRGTSKPCGECDSCYYRAKGFKEAGLTDPLLR